MKLDRYVAPRHSKCIQKICSKTLKEVHLTGEETNFKTDSSIKEIVCENVDWICLAQNKVADGGGGLL